MVTALKGEKTKGTGSDWLTSIAGGGAEGHSAKMNFNQSENKKKKKARG
jgi:hypothetical protein